tara:strand:+ start:593 stop:826 length:234 start_codon:yes stop_codon:yes gene_type:complete
MEVKVYSTPTCPWCQKVKAWLKEKEIKFTEFNVADDEAAQKEMVEKSGQMGVPVIIIDDKEPIVGFDEGKLKEALGL